MQTEILLELDRICVKNKISYQLFAGTLLGAIRHKGFIPWDDDIDVCLLREDYERLIQCCKRDLDEKYFLQCLDTDESTTYQYAKIRKNGTVFVNSVEQQDETHPGIYIDIFPLDNVKPHTLMGKLHPWVYNFFYVIHTSRRKGRVLKARNAFIRGLRYLFFYATKLIPKRVLESWVNRTLRLYQNHDTEYVNHLTNGVSKKRLKQYLRKKETFYDIDYMEFEGNQLPVPQNYHDVLVTQFGDYLQLPPEEERFPHHDIVKVVIGD